MTFSEHLLKLRKGRGLSQEELAKQLTLGVHTYQRYEYGEREPTLSTLIALADFYQISLDELVCRER
ncbi:MAG: helix-turn-helix transcriptional regulator [Ruminococcaceae bacterium]|nr:helix-turn-helix transcriptional regulator [Oscillospiraceae bacterium]